MKQREAKNSLISLDIRFNGPDLELEDHMSGFLWKSVSEPEDGIPMSGKKARIRMYDIASLLFLGAVILFLLKF